MEFTFRPLPVWPYPETLDRRSRYTFKASWSSTLDLLDRELSMLDGDHLVIGAGFRPQDIRLDGLPRANAAAPSHPGVEISFNAHVGGTTRRLVYRTDSCEYWQHNVRSIALGLEALRAVDRYGVTSAGQQYAGFAELEAPRDVPSASRGRDLIAKHGSVNAALMATHPDHGGTERDFRDVQAAREDRV